MPEYEEWLVSTVLEGGWWFAVVAFELDLTNIPNKVTG